MPWRSGGEGLVGGPKAQGETEMRKTHLSYCV